MNTTFELFKKPTFDWSPYMQIDMLAKIGHFFVRLTLPAISGVYISKKSVLHRHSMLASMVTLATKHYWSKLVASDQVQIWWKWNQNYGSWVEFYLKISKCPTQKRHFADFFWLSKQTNIYDDWIVLL